MGTWAKQPFYSEDFLLAVARGEVPSFSFENKFGRSTNVDSGIATDIWDRANATHDQDIWIPPTQARVHNIASSHADDDDTTGDGMRTVQVVGLASDWSKQEEEISLNGTGSVATASSYIRIFRMFGVTFGDNATNTGYITATAVTDTTVTAQINPSQGQTQMAIYSVPLGVKAFVIDWNFSYNKSAGAAGAIDMSLLVRKNADTATSGWLVKETQGLFSSGSTFADIPFRLPDSYPAKTDIKAQGVGSANDLDLSASFALLLENV